LLEKEKEMKKGLLVLAIAALVVPAFADLYPSAGPVRPMAVGNRDPVLWDNIPDGTIGGNAFSSQLDTVYPFRSGAADDFLCGYEDPTWECHITDVHWWGTWWNPGPPGNATAFLINIYADAGGMPTGAGMADPTPTALASYNIPISDISITDLGGGVEEYDVYLPEDAILQCTQHYWLEIVSVNTYPPQWGWLQAGANQQLNVGQQGFPLLGLPFWTPIDVDLAFILTGYCIPEPTSLLLLAAAGLLLRRR